MVHVPFVPLNVPPQQQIDYLLDAPNYDSLKLLIQVADDQSVFTYAARNAPAFAAFGGGGNGRIRVYGLFAQAGGGGQNPFAGFVPARLFRYFDEQTGSNLTASQSGARLNNIPRGNRVRSILLKTGVKLTTTAAGNNSYNTLSNTILSGNIKVMRGTNRQVRLYQDFFALREDASMNYSVTPDTGYGLIDFAQNGSLSEALDLSGAITGSTGDIDTFVQSDTTGAANQAELALYEELRYQPQSV